MFQKDKPCAAMLNPHDPSSIIVVRKKRNKRDVPNYVQVARIEGI